MAAGQQRHRCESLTDLSYPVVLLQCRKSGGDRFVESLRSDLYGVLNVSDILHRNCARSKNHVQKRSIFVFCSPVKPDRNRALSLRFFARAGHPTGVGDGRRDQEPGAPAQKGFEFANRLQCNFVQSETMARQLAHLGVV